jgi:hypothetical protein
MVNHGIISRSTQAIGEKMFEIMMDNSKRFENNPGKSLQECQVDELNNLTDIFQKRIF